MSCWPQEVNFYKKITILTGQFIMKFFTLDTEFKHLKQYLSMLTTLKDKKDKTTLFLYNGKIWQQQEHIFQFNFYINWNALSCQ